MGAIALQLMKSNKRFLIGGCQLRCKRAAGSASSSAMLVHAGSCWLKRGRAGRLAPTLAQAPCARPCAQASPCTQAINDTTTVLCLAASASLPTRHAMGDMVERCSRGAPAVLVTSLPLLFPLPQSQAKPWMRRWSAALWSTCRTMTWWCGSSIPRARRWGTACTGGRLLLIVQQWELYLSVQFCVINGHKPGRHVQVGGGSSLSVTHEEERVGVWCAVQFFVINAPSAGWVVRRA